MMYLLGFLVLIYGTFFYKSVRLLRAQRVGCSNLELVETQREFQLTGSRLTEGLELEFLAQYEDVCPVISEGYHTHHLAYSSPNQALVLWFFLAEAQAEHRVAILKLDAEGSVSELSQENLSWRELWEELHREPSEESGELEIDARRLGQAVSHYLEAKAKPMVQAYAEPAEGGLRRLSWSQVFGLFLRMLGKGKVGLSCDEKGALKVVSRKDVAGPDLDQLGWLFHDIELTVLLDLRYRVRKKQLDSRTEKNLWLLPASLVAFLVSFLGFFDWRTVLILAVVIFLHELGHWAAMRFFDYEDTSFMFLPFFGGLAVGRKKSPKLHESVLVFLAGPVPGILLAIALGLYWPTFRGELLQRFLVMLWVINLINLLPVLPLDGGRIVAATLFAKTPRAELAFRVLTGLALFGGYVALDDQILLFLGALVWAGTGSTKKVADICNEFRKEKDRAPTDFEVALRTYEKFQFDPVKHVQQFRTTQLDQVFQRMESSDASWGASLLWLAIYLICLAVAGSLKMTGLI